MIKQSIYWKTELMKLSLKLTLGRSIKRKWNSPQYGKFEKEVMIGFYIIRKLMESQKLPNFIASMKHLGNKYPNSGANVTLINNHQLEELYNFKEGKSVKFDLKFIINQIVHSYIFSPAFEVSEMGGQLNLSSIYFCYDDHRNKWIYEITLDTIINLFKKVAQSDVTLIQYQFNIQKRDYNVVQHDALHKNMERNNL